MDANSFGKQLRYFRRRARDPEKGGSLTQERLTHLMYEVAGLNYSFAAISDWERGKSQIPKDHRATLTGLVTTLGKHGGLLSLKETNSWFAAGNYMLLNGREIESLKTAGIDWHDLFPENERSDVLLTPFLAPPKPFQPIIGRDSVLEDLRQKLLGRETLAISAVRGLPGVGKTTVALALAHDAEIRSVFPDGILWVGLGRDPDVFFQLGLWCRALGMNSNEIAQMTAIGMRIEAIRSALSNRAALLIIDDAWQPSHAQWFRLGGIDCSHIVTTRLPTVAHDFSSALQIVIETLSLDDSVQLLKVLAPETHQLYPQAIQEIAKTSSGLPLALVLIGNYLRKVSATGQQRRLEVAIENLKIPTFRQQIGAQQSGTHPHPSLSLEQTISLENIIGISIQALPDNRLRQNLSALGVFPPKPSSFSEEAGLAVLGEAASIETLDTLVDMGLIETSGQVRYQIHQAIVDYIQEQGILEEAKISLARYYQEWLSNSDSDYSIITTEFENILAAINLAKIHDRPDLFVILVSEFYSFLENRALWELIDRLVPEAVENAKRIGEFRTAVELLRNWGRAVERRRDRDAADELWEEGYKIARDHKLFDLLVLLLADRSLSASSADDFDQAEQYLNEALEVSEANNYPLGNVMALGYSGRLAYQTGQTNKMIPYLDQAITIAKEHNIREKLTWLLNLRGAAAYELESLDAAEKYALEALALAREFGGKNQISNLLTNLGELETERGQPERAKAYLNEALVIVRDIGNTAREAHILKDLGKLAMRSGEAIQSQQYYEEALHLADQEDNTWLMAYVRINWGELLLEFGELEKAERLFREIIGRFPSESKTRYIIALARFGLSQIEYSRGEVMTAAELAKESEKVLEELGHQRLQEVKDFISSLSFR